MTDDLFIWFDFGGVLSPPIEDLFTTYERRTGLTADALKCAMHAVAQPMGLPTLAPIELGVLSEPEWGSLMRRHLEDHHPDQNLSIARLEAFGEQWFSGIVANAHAVTLLHQVHALGYGVGVLSNNVLEWGPYWRPIITPVEDVVSAIIDSAEVGARKPDEEIFRVAETAVGATADQCVLIDDLAENCAAARRYGWQALQFVDNTGLRTQLEELVGQPLASHEDRTGMARAVHRTGLALRGDR